MNSLSGKYVKCGDYRAFVLASMPPEVKWSASVLRSLSDADRLIGQLSGAGKKLPNPYLLVRPFVKTEAVLSSRIEGTQATLRELLASDAGAAVRHSPDDLREVGNYVTAMDYGIQRLSELPLSLRLVREIHGKLMQDVRGGYATPGEFRKTQNWIGPAGCTLQNASYIPPSPDMLTDCLGQWEHFLHDRTLPPLVQAGLMHWQFEAIHPFLDGNGRVGRLLIILFLMDRKVLAVPSLYLSAFFEATRSEYYDRLLAVTQKSDFNGWLEYFLNGVARMSEDVLDRTERIYTLLSGWHQLIKGRRARVLPAILDLLAENPFWSVRKAAERLNVPFNTADRAMKILTDLNILFPQGNAKRDRVFCAKEILAILEEPAKIKAGK